MAYLTVKHKVKDYKAWKEVFDNFRDTRKSGGEKSYSIMSEENDPNRLHVFFEWDTEDRARTFMQSTELKDAMQKAGVIEEPQIEFLKALEDGKL